VNDRGAIDGSSQDADGTIHRGLNERGDLTCKTLDSNFTFHGLLRARDGTFVPFDVPGSGVGNFNGTTTSSLNSSGTICGGFSDSNGGAHGFVQYRDGSIVPFDAPGVGSQTDPVVINDPGEIAGLWFDANGVGHGFLMQPHDE
jgi:hypothetical protein